MVGNSIISFFENENFVLIGDVNDPWVRTRTFNWR